MFGLGKSTKAVVGLDIGSSAVKAVELKASGKSFKVTAFGIEPVPPDSIVDGAIIDGAAVADAIRRLFESKNIRTKDVAASLAGNAVIVKKITLPKMTEQELAESIYWEAEQYIPFDIQDVNLDYQVVGQGSGAAAGTMDVLLVAAKKEKIADYTGVISQAGRSPGILDVDPSAPPPRTCSSRSRRRSTSSAARPAPTASTGSSSAAAPRASTASSTCWPSASIHTSSCSIRSRR